MQYISTLILESFHSQLTLNCILRYSFHFFYFRPPPYPPPSKIQRINQGLIHLRSRVRDETVEFSKENRYVWTGPKLHMVMTVILGLYFSCRALAYYRIYFAVQRPTNQIQALHVQQEA